MKSFFGYTRVSTARQGEKGVSLQEQRDAILRYAARNALDVTQWFEERQTAAKSGRPVFTRMMRCLQKSTANGVIMHKIDRGARNLKDWADLAALLDHGIDVHFANESLDMHSRGGRLSADIQAVVAADYIRNLREETKKGFYGRLKQGLCPMRAPHGYLDMGKGKLKEIDPVRGPLIRKMFELYATGRYSLDRLGNEMHALGLRNWRGKRLSKNGLSNILNNPFYFGLIRVRRNGQTFAGAHAPLIPKSLFDRVQQVLRGKCNAKVVCHEFLFRKLFTCAMCGRTLTGEIQKRQRYYRCHEKRCPTHCIREDAIEAAVLAKLSCLRFGEREKSYIAEKIPALKQDWVHHQEESAKGVALQLKQNQDRMARLTDAYIDRAIEKAVFEERKTSLLMERKDLEERLSTARQNPTLFPDHLEGLFELAESAYASYLSALPEEKRELLKILSSNRQVGCENVMIELKSPFKEIENRSLVTDGTPQRDELRGAQTSGSSDESSQVQDVAAVWDPIVQRAVEHCMTSTPLLA